MTCFQGQIWRNRPQRGKQLPKINHASHMFLWFLLFPGHDAIIFLL